MKWINAQMVDRRALQLTMLLVLLAAFSYAVITGIPNAFATGIPNTSSVAGMRLAASQDTLLDTRDEKAGMQTEHTEAPQIGKPIPDEIPLQPQANWVSYETETFVTYAGNAGQAKAIGLEAEQILSRIGPRYRYPIGKKIFLFIYDDKKSFLYGSPSSQAAGYTYPQLNAIAILRHTGDFSVTLAHEISHVVFIPSVTRVDTVPQWFIEGLAIFESQPGVSVINIEKYALARDIPQFIGAPNEQSRPQLKDYAEGYLMVTFIVNNYGADALYEIIDRLQEGAAYNDAVLRSLNKSQQELNAEWEAFARRQFVFIWLAQLPDLIWYGMAILFLFAVTIAFTRSRRRLRQLDDDESDGDGIPYDDPRFQNEDYGPGARV